MFLYDKQRRAPLDWALYTWKRLYKKNDFWISDAEKILQKLLECGASLDKDVAWQLVAPSEQLGRSLRKTYLDYIKEDSVLKERIDGWLVKLIKKRREATLPEAKEEKAKQLSSVASWKKWHKALKDEPEEKKFDEEDDIWFVTEEKKSGDEDKES